MFLNVKIQRHERARHRDEAQAPGTTRQYDRSVVSREMSVAVADLCNAEL